MLRVRWNAAQHNFGIDWNELSIGARVSNYLSAFIEEMKASGFVKRSLEASGNGDVTVPR